MSAISSLSNPSLQNAASSRTNAPAGGPDASNPFAEVTSEEWLGIILEELSNQDPFEPNDTSATLEQLNSLRSIESDITLQDQLESLVLQNSIGQAGSLIGREVEGLSTSGLPVTGIVDSVRVIEGKSQLQLDTGSSVDFSNVTNVSSVPDPAPGIIPAPGIEAASGLVPAGGTPVTGAAAASTPAELIQALAGIAENPDGSTVDADSEDEEPSAS